MMGGEADRQSPWASESRVGETEAEKEEAGVGGHHRQQVGAQTRSHAPPGQACGSVCLPSPPTGGPGARSSLPAAGRAGAPGGGRGHG